MENRIEINGVWYVREDQQQEEPIVLDLLNFEGCGVEDTNYYWEATRMYKDDGSLYDGIDIKFTDKRSKPWKEEHWDNNLWMKAIYNNEEPALKEAKESMDDNGIKIFKQFLQELVKKEWL